MQYLVDGARTLGISLSDEQLNAFQTYYEVLSAWNKRVNLTRIMDYEAVQVKHFLDSLSPVLAIKQANLSTSKGTEGGMMVVDVGSGGGFPGVPLRIAFPDLRLTLLEATQKKVEFLRFLVEQLGLTDVRVIDGRAEEVSHQPALRERFDLALARALAGMATLAELTLPLVRQGGLVIAQKGEYPTAELAAAQKAIVMLGGQVQDVLPVEVAGLEGARHLVVLEKVSLTPQKYPRRPGVPAKRPLV